MNGVDEIMLTSSELVGSSSCISILTLCRTLEVLLEVVCLALTVSSSIDALALALLFDGDCGNDPGFLRGDVDAASLDGGCFDVVSAGAVNDKHAKYIRDIQFQQVLQHCNACS
jgi:hypothetical protein